MDNRIQKLPESRDSLQLISDVKERKKAIGIVVAKSRLLYPHLASLSQAEIEAIVATWMEILEDVPTNLFNKLYVRASKRRRNDFPISANDILEEFDIHLEQEEEHARRQAKEQEEAKLKEQYIRAMEFAEFAREDKSMEQYTCDCQADNDEWFVLQTRVAFDEGHWWAWLECPKLVRKQHGACRVRVPLGTVYPD